MIKYSVIVPVYNSEKTLTRCLSSLTAKNREDVQIIVVNDGSTDSSDAIIREFAVRYPQIFYICQKNAGVSQARNAGLDAAQGTYITFVDSDDYVREDYFRILDQTEDCDLLVFCHHVLGADDGHLPTLFSELETCKDQQRLELLLSSRRIMSPWDKRFRRSIIEVKCDEIRVEPEQIIYNDVTGEDSLSRKYRPLLDLQIINVFTHVADTITISDNSEKKKQKLLAITDYLFVKNVFSCISEEFKQKKLRYLTDRKQIVEICNNFRQPISDQYVNVIHRMLRLALAWKLYYPFYLVSYWVRGRKYQSQKTTQRCRA